VILHFTLPLALTVVVELPVAALLGLRTKLALAAVVAVSLVTNPVLNYAGLLLAQVMDWGQSAPLALVVVAVGEIVVVIVEWRLLVWALGGSQRHLLMIAALMNAASALVGLVLWV
jgi:hypothetical protein